VVEPPPSDVRDEALFQGRFVEVGVGVEEARGAHRGTGVDRLVDRFVPASLGTDVNDGAAVGDHDPAPHMPMLANPERLSHAKHRSGTEQSIFAPVLPYDPIAVGPDPRSAARSPDCRPHPRDGSRARNRYPAWQRSG
jgi:hypothetical protein